MACRRACWSPRLASVISRSRSGATALAFASVVLIRSCVITSRERFMSSDLRCEALRLSFPRSFWWRMGLRRVSRTLSRAQREAAGLEGLDDLFDRLATEVRDRVQLGLRLLQELADGLDAGPLQAVVGAHAQLELLDQDVVHPAGRPATGLRTRRSRSVEPAVSTAAQRLEALLVGEDREARDQDLGRLAQSRLGLHRAVGLDIERELVVVGPLAHTRRLHLVGHALDRREDRVDRDHADGLIVRLVLLGGRVAAPAPDRQVHLELGLLLES